MSDFIRYGITKVFLIAVTYVLATSIHRYARDSRYNKDGWKDLFFAIASGLSLLCLIFPKS